MLKYLNPIFVLSIILVFVQCSNSDPTSPSDEEFRAELPRTLTTSENHLIESDNTFGSTLFREINQAEADENVFVSPLSVSMALGMTYNGADGATQEAMQQTLELQGLSLEEINKSYQSLIELLVNLDPKVQFQIANSIWHEQDYVFNVEFLNRCQHYFNAEVSGLDFADPVAVAQINQWVSDQTNGKIQNIVDQIESQIVMFLINAIYFKGTWTYEFDPEKTEDDWFTTSDGTQIPCQMMMVENEFPYLETNTFQAVDLPYGDGFYTMTIFVPHQSSNVDALINQLTSENWQNWFNEFNKRKIVLSLPKFKFEYELLMNDVLTALGMGVAFSSYHADFSQMSSGLQLYIDNVKHKTFVEVSEEGTEAAAVTSVQMGVTSIGPDQMVFLRVDRPFFFTIRENNSGTILFMGKIVEPVWQ